MNLADGNTKGNGDVNIKKKNSEDIKIDERLLSLMINCSLHKMYSMEALEKLKLYFGCALELLKGFEYIKKYGRNLFLVRHSRNRKWFNGVVDDHC